MNESKEIECPICKKSIIVTPNKVVNSTKMIRCDNCCADFIYPLPCDNEIKNSFAKQYYLNLGDVDNMHRMKSKTFEDYLKIISSYKQNGKLLDVGTGYGFLVEKALELGFDAYGIDVSEYPLSIAKQNISEERFFVEHILSTHFENESFDVITLVDVFEQFNDPLGVLKKINSLLKKDGVLFLLTPDPNSLGAYIQNINLDKYHSEHVYRYKNKTLNFLFKNANFEVLSTKKIWKTLNILFFSSHFSIYRLFPLTQIFNILSKIKFINKIPFKVRIGSVMYLLKKI